jgi:hypothetical protein
VGRSPCRVDYGEIVTYLRRRARMYVLRLVQSEEPVDCLASLKVVLGSGLQWGWWREWLEWKWECGGAVT